MATLTDRDWVYMAEKFMNDMDFPGNVIGASCQCVAGHHGLIVAADDRIDGTKGSNWSASPKARTAMQTQEE